jgi:hypothetical protein
VREKFAHKEKKMAKNTWLRGAALALIAALSLTGCSKANAQAGGTSGGGGSASSAVKEAPESDFTVELTGDSAGVIITKYNGNAKEVRIPAIIQGLPVRAIKYPGLNGNKTITSVVLPEGMTYLSGFTDCTNLTSVNFPTTLTAIQGFIKTPLTAVDLSRTSIEVIGGFENCTALTSVVLPASIKEIQQEAFAGCKALTTVTVPETVTKIKFSTISKTQSYAFAGCSSLPLATQAKLKELGYTSSF